MLATQAIDKSTELLVVAGLSLKNLHPRVWDPASEYFLPDLKAVMVSYADFHRVPHWRRQAMTLGLRGLLAISRKIRIFLDNGAFYFAKQDDEALMHQYEEFVEVIKPEWQPIRRDFIPYPQMSWQEQELCFSKTMQVSLNYQYNGYIPVVHIGK